MKLKFKIAIFLMGCLLVYCFAMAVVSVVDVLPSISEVPRFIRTARAIEKEYNRIQKGLAPRHWNKEPKDYFNSKDAVAICKAIADDDSALLKRLLDTHIDVNHQGKGGMTFLFFAYFEGNFDAFKLLLRYGASPDIPLTANADVYRTKPQPQKGDSVLGISCADYVERGGFFEEAVKTSKEMQRVLKCYLEYPRGNQGACLQFMVEKGVDLNIRSRGTTLLHLAASDNPEIIYKLVELGADVNILDQQGNSVVDLIRAEVENPNFQFKKRHAEVLNWLEQRDR